MSRAPGIVFRWSLLLVVGVAACGDPELTFYPGSARLTVGQRASVVVTSGGDGSDLVESSLKLVDSSGVAFGAKDLQATKISAEETEFVVPSGVATGTGTLSIKTSKGPSFSGDVGINRLMAMRDLSGKIWLLALTGAGGAAQFAEAQAGTFGLGIGHVAVGYGGRLVASTARTTNQFFLGWLDADMKPSAPLTLDTTLTVNDLIVTPGGVTLLGTSDGLYFAPPPNTTDVPPAKPAVTALGQGNTVSVAVDKGGTRAVAMVDPGSAGTVTLTLLDLATSPPAVLNTLPTAWAGHASGTTGGALAVAMSGDGKNILAVDGSANKLALFVEGQSAPVEQAFDASESGAVAVAAAPDGTTFFVANGTSRNVSRVDTTGGSVTFGTPLSLDAGANSQSGQPVDIAASAADEVVVLLEHDLVLLYDKGSKASTLQFPNLFKDKVTGQVGGEVGIQP